MSYNYTLPGEVGLQNVGSYQVSSIPYCTSSLTVPPVAGTPVVVNFPDVTKFVLVRNLVDATGSAAPLRVGFSQLGVQGTNYLVLKNDESFTADYKVIRLYLLGHSTSATSASVVAGLTNIRSGSLPTNWSGSVGVG